MTTDNLLITKIDPDAERRRVLARVYNLLLQLAEQGEKNSVNLELIHGKETEKPTSVQESFWTKHVDSAPSQRNIPP